MAANVTVMARLYQSTVFCWRAAELLNLKVTTLIPAIVNLHPHVLFLSSVRFQEE